MCTSALPFLRVEEWVLIKFSTYRVDQCLFEVGQLIKQIKKLSYALLDMSGLKRIELYQGYF